MSYEQEVQKQKISNLERAIGDMAKAQQQQEAARVMRELRSYIAEILTTSFDKGTAYTNLIIFAVYAGSFGLLTQAGGELTVRCLLVVALALTISLGSFAIGEAYKMVTGVLSGLKQRRLLIGEKKPEVLLAELKRFQDQQRLQTVDWPILVWAVSFSISSISATIAFCLLLYNFLAKLLSAPFWP
jgi:hypothetical protein